MQIVMHHFFQSQSGAVWGDSNPSTPQADSSAGGCAAAAADPLPYLSAAAVFRRSQRHRPDPVAARSPIPRQAWLNKCAAVFRSLFPPPQQLIDAVATLCHRMESLLLSFPWGFRHHPSWRASSRSRSWRHSMSLRSSAFSPPRHDWAVNLPQ